MAAPMEEETKKRDSDESDKIPAFLDPSSPKFDPKRALYHSQTPVPIPDAKQFNNLAEFENFLQGKDAKTIQKKKPKPKEQLPGIIALRAAAQAKENVRKAAIMAKNAGPSERSKTHERRNRLTTVFTKMESYKEGPLSLLRRCVQERLRVIVVVRAAVAVRSRCRGYVIGFDKHFNMALMDVDEKFIRPIPQKKRKMKCTKDTGSQERLLTEETDMLSITSDDPRSHSVGNSLESRPAEGRKSDIQVDLREKIKLSTTSGRHLTSNEKDTRESQSEHASFKETLNRNSECKGNLRTDDSIEQSSTDNNSKRLEVKRSRDFKDHYRNYMSDSNVFVKRQQERLKDSGSKSDGESRSLSRDRQKKAGGDLKKSFQPFWPLYKKWTENRCYSKYETVTRHVNQLFIRGDNIVSVSIAEY